MKRLMIPLVCALALSACTPNQVHLVNLALAEHGQAPLNEVEASTLYCSLWPTQRVAYLQSIGVNLMEMGPAPTCPEPPTLPKPGTEPPTPAGADAGGAYGSVIAAVWPPHLWSIVSCIQWYESGNNPNAVGGVGERGLMQIHPNHFIPGGWGYPGISAMDGSGLAWNQMFDPVANHRAARFLYDVDGNFSGWSTARLCT